jgi:hypothetical protein
MRNPYEPPPVYTPQEERTLTRFTQETLCAGDDDGKLLKAALKSCNITSVKKVTFLLYL